MIQNLKKHFSKLKKEDAKAVHRHLEDARKIILHKKNFLEKGEVLFGEKLDSKYVLKELDKLMKVYADMQPLLYSAKISLKELIKSIEEEQKIIAALEKIALKPGVFEKELRNEIILGEIMEHQLNLCADLAKYSSDILNSFGKNTKTPLVPIAENLSNSANYLLRVMMEQEFPALSIAYNMLKFEGWPEVEKRILALKEKMPNIETIL